MDDSNLLQVRAERSEAPEPFTAMAQRASEASHPARPTNVKKRPKGAFLLSATLTNLLTQANSRSADTSFLRQKEIA
jgi:hypothetical protein